MMPKVAGSVALTSKSSLVRRAILRKDDFNRRPQPKCEGGGDTSCFDASPPPVCEVVDRLDEALQVLRNLPAKSLSDRPLASLRKIMSRVTTDATNTFTRASLSYVDFLCESLDSIGSGTN